MNVLDLFSGIGGFSLGLERAGMRTAAFCEIEPYCRKVLTRHFPGIPIHDDIRQLDGSRYARTVDLICGGYPCQPFSAAGKQQGEKDPRHLWPEMHRIIREARPRWVVCENVRGHVSLGFDTVAAQLEDDGFTVWPFIVPACSVNAPHRRDRLWIVAYAEGIGRGEAGRIRGGETPLGQAWNLRTIDGSETLADAPCGLLDGSRDARPRWRIEPANSGQAMADSISTRLEGYAGNGEDEAGRKEPRGHASKSGICRAMADSHGKPEIGATVPRQECDPWHIESRMGGSIDGLSTGLDFPDRWADGSWEAGIPRIASGVPNRVSRLKALGNAVVPEIPYRIGRAIIAYEKQLEMAA